MQERQPQLQEVESYRDSDPAMYKRASESLQFHLDTYFDTVDGLMQAFRDNLKTQRPR